METLRRWREREREIRWLNEAAFAAAAFAAFAAAFAEAAVLLKTTGPD